MVISTNAHPTNGKALISNKDGKRHWELFKGVRKSSGNWQWQAITENSDTDNLRPIIPLNPETNDTYLLWMRGKYVSYTEIDTAVVMLKNP